MILTAASSGFAMMDEVVITGSAIVCGLGNHKAAVWEALLAGKTAVGPLDGFSASASPRPTGARVSGVKPARGSIPPRIARLMTLPAAMLLHCARDALLEAALDPLALPGEEMAFFAAMGMVDYDPAQLLPAVKKAQTGARELNSERFFAEGYREIHPLWPLLMLNNVGFCQSAIVLGFKGENGVFADQADAGAQAVVEGLWTIREQRARVAVVGGVSPELSPFRLARAHLAGSTKSSRHPAETASPFCPLPSGSHPGEGGGALVLESRSTAMARGAPFAGRIGGYGSACGKAAESSAAIGRAIVAAADQAISRAGLAPRDIDLIMAHGDGDGEGDRHEIRAMEQFFAASGAAPRFFSSKAALGDCVAGATLLDMVLAVCILEHGIVPPTLERNPARDGRMFSPIGAESQHRRIRHILINAGSSEGQWVSLVVEACR